MKLPSCKLDLIHIHMFIESISFSFTKRWRKKNKERKSISDKEKDIKGIDEQQKSIVIFTNCIQQTSLPSYNNRK